MVMPSEQAESFTDDPPTPTAAHFPEPLEEVSPKQPEEDTPTAGPGQSEGRQEEEEEGRLQPTHQSRIIQNVDEIFHTIEGLMSKLRQLKASFIFFYSRERRASLAFVGRSSSLLRYSLFVSLANVLTPLQEIEEAHQKLLKTLSDAPGNQESEDQRSPSATVSRTPSLDRGSINSERKAEFRSFREIEAIR